MVILLKKLDYKKKRISKRDYVGKKRKKGKAIAKKEILMGQRRREKNLFL
jgi:hypothetical protein